MVQRFVELQCLGYLIVTVGSVILNDTNLASFQDVLYQPRKKARRSVPNSKTLPRDTRTPDDISEADLDTIAWHGTGKTYDTVNVSAVYKESKVCILLFKVF